eukprot:8805644-Pyramimonas_sp.AAC.1
MAGTESVVSDVCSQEEVKGSSAATLQKQPHPRLTSLRLSFVYGEYIVPADVGNSPPVVGNSPPVVGNSPP